MKKGWKIGITLIIVLLVVFSLYILLRKDIHIINDIPKENNPSQEELKVCEDVPITNYFSCENGSVTCPDERCLNLSGIDKDTCVIKVNQDQRNYCYIELAIEYLDLDVCNYVYNDSRGSSGMIDYCRTRVEKQKYIVENSLEDDNTNYTKMENQIVICNANVLYDGVGNCYSKWDRGCPYNYLAKDCPNYAGTIVMVFESHGFSKEESLNLCEKFVSEDMKNDCINKFS
jgi:hypothetical protein